MLAAIEHGVKQEGGVRVVIWGPEGPVHNIRDNQIQPRLEGEGVMAGFKSREVVAHLARDDPLGGRAPGTLNVNRVALVLGPVTIKTSVDYMVFNIPWCPAVVGHLAWMLDTLRRQLGRHILLCFLTQSLRQSFRKGAFLSPSPV